MPVLHNRMIFNVCVAAIAVYAVALSVCGCQPGLEARLLNPGSGIDFPVQFTGSAYNHPVFMGRLVSFPEGYLVHRDQNAINRDSSLHLFVGDHPDVVVAINTGCNFKDRDRELRKWLSDVRSLNGLRAIEMHHLQWDPEVSLLLSRLTQLRKIRLLNSSWAAHHTAINGMQQLTATEAEFVGWNSGSRLPMAGPPIWPALRSLAVVDCHVAAPWLQGLVDLTELDSLAVHGQDVSGRDFEILANLGRLRYLSLNNCRFTHFREVPHNLPHLEQLFADHTTGVPQALSGLQSQGLRDISLIGTDVSDADVCKLKRFPALRVVRLDHTPISDASIDVLLQLPALTHVSHDGTRISFDGGNRLQAVLTIRRSAQQ